MKIISLVLILTIFLSLANTSAIDDIIQSRVTMLDSSLLDVVWCGNTEKNDNSVLILTSNGTVYKSSDRGEDWEKMSDVFQSTAVKHTQDLQTKVGFINRIVKSPVDSNLVMFLGSEGINYITEDCGNTIKSYGKGNNFREFSYHPFQRNWILATSWRNCKKVDPSVNCHVTKELYITKDLGKNWDKVGDYIVQFSWGVKSNNKESSVPEQRIIWSQELGAKENQKISGWNMKTHLFYSDDFLKTKTMVVSQGNKFLLTDKYIYVAQVVDSESQKVNLMLADSQSLDYNFEVAQLPEELKQHSFTILDSSDDTVFLNINHNRPNSPLGAIYKSDSSGFRFTKSLEYNIRDSQDGQCDFEKIQGLEGIYIANVYQQETANEFLSMSNDDDADQIQFKTTSQGKTKVTSNLKTFTQKLQDVKQTKISFDQGGMWQPVVAPVKDSKQKNINCDINEGCSLHLHSVSSKMLYGPIYTSENALGIIMGTGNVGKSLKYRKDQINTYLSRDAGLTWYEVKKGSHIYEFADHGGLILMADDQQATQYVYYSWDEGLTWSKIKFYDKDVEITNIITEPTNIGQRFIVYGTTNVQTNRNIKVQGVVVSINMEDLHVQQCSGVDNPNTDDSDYEYWSPNGKLSPDCLLGRKTTYARRKRLAKCYNGQQFDRVVKVEHCECTEEDWECDLYYEREDNGSGKCIFKGNDEYLTGYDAPQQCENYYYVSQGYRKIAGDSCVGGVDHSAVKLSCPYFSFLGQKSWKFILFVISLLYGGYYVYQNQEQSMDYLLQITTYLSSLIKFGERQLPNQQSSGGQYMDFSSMDLEKNQPDRDEDLMDHYDEKQIEKEDEDDEENINVKQDQTKNTINDEQQQQSQQSQEESNLLDADDDDNQNDGFDPRI